MKSETNAKPGKKPQNGANRRQNNRGNAGSKAGVAPRRFAAYLVAQVLEEGLSLQEALEQPSKSNLPDEDVALARAIATTTLRRKGQIDKILAKLMKNPLGKRAGSAPHLLRIGAAQILFMDIPDHAAVNTTLEAAKRDHKAKHFSKLLNGVLRTITREREELLTSLNPLDALPDWLAQSWKTSYGAQQTRSMAEQILHEPSVDIAVKGSAEEWAEKLDGIVLPNGSVRLRNKRPIPTLDGYGDGAWWVQDVAARLAASLIQNPKDKRILDLCAAPGGKTAYFASKGAEVTALDISEKRLERVEENLKRLKLKAEIKTADMMDYSSDEKFDAIFLDAPCSATGTIRKHPEAMWLKTPQQVESLAKQQLLFLKKAADHLKPDGQLIYCTCSLQSEEGEDIVQKFLQSTSDIKLKAISTEEVANIPGVINEDGMMRTLPHHLSVEENEKPAPSLSGMDGFFAARFVKTG